MRQRPQRHSQYAYRQGGMDNDIFNNGDDNIRFAGKENLMGVKRFTNDTYLEKLHRKGGNDIGDAGRHFGHQQPPTAPQPKQQQNSDRTRSNADETQSVSTSSPDSQSQFEIVSAHEPQTTNEGRSKKRTQGRVQQLARGELFTWIARQVASLVEYGVKALKSRLSSKRKLSRATKSGSASGKDTYPASSSIGRSLTLLPNDTAPSAETLLEKSFVASTCSSESDQDVNSSDSVYNSISSEPTRTQPLPFRRTSSSSENANSMAIQQDTPPLFTSIKSCILSLSSLVQHHLLSPFATEKAEDYVLPKTRRKTLVLDLDETLIHSTPRGGRGYDFSVEVAVEGHACLYYVYKRPHVDLFLRKVQEWYKVVIFTASMAEYADPVIDRLDQTGELVNGRLFRNACTQRNGSYLKDLASIEPDLRDVCLIDNSPVSYVLNPANAIPIEGWMSDPNDEALLDLIPFLDALRFTDDVRSVLSLRLL